MRGRKVEKVSKPPRDVIYSLMNFEGTTAVKSPLDSFSQFSRFIQELRFSIKFAMHIKYLS